MQLSLAMRELSFLISAIRPFRIIYFIFNARIECTISQFKLQHTPLEFEIFSSCMLRYHSFIKMLSIFDSSFELLDFSKCVNIAGGVRTMYYRWPFFLPLKISRVDLLFRSSRPVQIFPHNVRPIKQRKVHKFLLVFNEVRTHDPCVRASYAIHSVTKECKHLVLYASVLGSYLTEKEQKFVFFIVS